MKSNLKLNEKLPPLKTLIGLGLGLIIAIYGLYEAFDLLSGPVLEIEYPANGQTIKDPLITIKGKTKRISKIFINGRQFFTGDDGSFNESLLLGYGYNIIEIKVQDQFGRQITKTLSLVLD